MVFLSFFHRRCRLFACLVASITDETIEPAGKASDFVCLSKTLSRMWGPQEKQRGRTSNIPTLMSRCLFEKGSAVSRLSPLDPKRDQGRERDLGDLTTRRVEVEAGIESSYRILRTKKSSSTREEERERKTRSIESAARGTTSLFLLKRRKRKKKKGFLPLQETTKHHPYYFERLKRRRRRRVNS